jgi:PAS domain S-box-containing protein
MKNITSRFLKSKKEHSSDDRFTAISNMSPDGIMTATMLGYITYVNPAFTTLTGFSEEELVGKHVINLPTLKGRNMKSYMDIVKDFIKGKISTTSFQFPYNRKDGSSGIGDAFFKTIMVNGKREVMGIIKDVTDKKMKEEEYQNIFKSSPEGIVHLDLDGIIKDINNSGLKLLNIDASEYIGKSIFSIESELGENEINMVDIYNEIISNNQVDPFELKINVDNSYKLIEIYVSLIKVYEENLGIQILLRDITQQKEIENEKKLYMDNLEKMVEERTNQILDNEKMVTLAKVSSMIAHDLKGPLQIINNSLHLIKYRYRNSTQTRGC